MDALGYKRDLDPSVALSLVFSQNTFFSQQSMSHELLTKGIRTVPVDQQVSARSGILLTKPKASFKDAIHVEPGRYQELVDEGVEDLISNVRIIVEGADFGERHASATRRGGQASRATGRRPVQSPSTLNATRSSRPI